MIKIEAIEIKQLPFDGLVFQGELLNFEGIPVLVHYTDSRKNDVIGYQVDFEGLNTRWVYTRITKDELFLYLIGSKSLLDTFKEIKSEYIFIADYSEHYEILSVKFLSSYLLPDIYLPGIDSLHRDELTDFYLGYFKENYYDYRMKENSVILKIESSDKKHGSTIGAKEAATVLNGATSSMLGYIKVRSFKELKNDFGDVNKITKRINGIANSMSPRITATKPGSLEIWLAIDTVVYHGDDNYFMKIKDGLIEEYKQDVLDVDFTSEEDANVINEKFNEDERKLIYEPLIKLLDNDDFTLSISDAKKTIKRNNYRANYSTNFRDKILPPPTLEKLQNDLDKKNKIISIVINLKEGENINNVRKKELMDNLLFTQEIAETPFDIPSPITIENNNYNLKKSLRCILAIDEKGNLLLFNNDLNLSANGTEMSDIIHEIKHQFHVLVQNADNIIKKNIPLARLISEYIDIGFKE